MPSQPADGGQIFTADRTTAPPDLDMPLRHVQAWLEHTVSARGLCGVLVVAILVLLAVSVWATSVAVAPHRNSGPVSHLFEAGVPGHAVTARRYKLVSD